MARRIPTTPDLAALVPSFRIKLTALNRSPSTLRVYMSGVRRYLEWLTANDHHPEITRTHVTAWVADMLDTGSSPATAAARLAGVRQFSKWLAAEGELSSDPLLGLAAPKADAPIVPVLTEDELKRLLKSCQGKRLCDRRDEAIVRLLHETGMRAGECVALNVDDIDMVRMVAVIVRGKGGRGRMVAFGSQTALALDRYMRVRRHHLRAEERPGGQQPLWLGEYTTGRLGYHGLRQGLAARAAAAGLASFHPHMLRHTWAHKFNAAGGSDGALMALAGWRDPAMVLRYAAVTRADRALAEARKLHLGDI